MNTINAPDTEISLEDDLICEHLNNYIKADLKGSLKKLFPDVTEKNGVYHIGPFQINMHEQQWTTANAEPYRFRTNLERFLGPQSNFSAPSTDFIDLYAKVYGLTFQAPKKVCAILGFPYSPKAWLMQNGLPGHSEEYAVAAAETVEAVADHALFQRHGYRRAGDIAYRNPDGTIRNFTRIYSNGEKQWCVSMTPYRSLSDGTRLWAYGYPSKPIPCHMDAISASESKLLIVSDENAMQFIETNYRGIIGSTIVTTWPGGNDQGIEKVDWEHLRDKTVTVLPECSKVGFSKTGKLIKVLQKSGARKIMVVCMKQTFEATQSGKDEGKALAADLFHAFNSAPQTLDEFYRDAKEFFDLELKTQSSLSEPVPWSVLDASSEEEMPWLLENVIRKGERGMLYARKGNGKTWLILIICASVVAGAQTLGGKPGAQKRLKVLLVDGENPVSVLKDRLRKLTKVFNYPENALNRIDFYSASYLKRKVELDDPDVREALKPRIDAADVVVIDNVNCTWPSAMSALPEGSAGLNAFVNELGAIGKTVILITHTTKDGKTSFGSYTKDMGMDTRMFLKSDERKTNFGLTVTVKSRSGELTEPLNISLKKDSAGEFCVQIEGGQQEIGFEEGYDGELDFDTADAPINIPPRQEVSEALSESVPDNPDTLSGVTNAAPDALEVAQTPLDAQNLVDVVDTLNLSDIEKIVLELYRKGATSARKIKKASEEAVAAGVAGAIRIPRCRVSTRCSPSE